MQIYIFHCPASFQTSTLGDDCIFGLVLALQILLLTSYWFSWISSFQTIIIVLFLFWCIEMFFNGVLQFSKLSNGSFIMENYVS